MPAELDHLILACLAKDPADRPQSAAAVAHALDAVQVGSWSDDDATAWWSQRDTHGSILQSSEEILAATGGQL